jgi:serine protease Do
MRQAGQAARAAADAADRAVDGEVAQAVQVTPDSPLDRARRGTVVIERAGKQLGLGAVLAGDGRILTALSPLGNGNNLDVRFSDGSLMRVRVGHTDRAWDLALLIPQNGRWAHGLKPSKTAALQTGSRVRAVVNVGDKSVAPSRVIVRGLRTLLGGDSELLRDGVDLGTRFTDKDRGSPIIDDQGRVVGLVAEACSPEGEGNQDCKRVPYGVPVSAIRAFLRTVPRDAVPPAPWLGIQGAAVDAGPVKGVRVLDVHPASPAGAAGLRGGKGGDADVVVAVDGHPVEDPKALAEAIQRHAVGESVQLLVFGDGRFRSATLTLRAAPEAGASEAPRRKK